jgi:hypothetical protein
MCISWNKTGLFVLLQISGKQHLMLLYIQTAVLPNTLPKRHSVFEEDFLIAEENIPIVCILRLSLGDS